MNVKVGSNEIIHHFQYESYKRLMLISYLLDNHVKSLTEGLIKQKKIIYSKCIKEFNIYHEFTRMIENVFYF